MRHPISRTGVLFMLAVSMGFAANVSAQPARAPSPDLPPVLERQKEVALALSACPASVAGKAGVWALERSGYVKVRESQNGFTAIVQRTLPNSVEPRCMDAEGTRTHLPRTLKVAALRAEGKSREEIRRFVAEAFAKGTFQPPARPGVDYMLSTQNVVIIDEDKGIVAPFPPHVMFYAPYLTNAELGSDGTPASPFFVVEEGTPHALVIVPVGAHGGASHGAADGKRP